MDSETELSNGRIDSVSVEPVEAIHVSVALGDEDAVVKGLQVTAYSDSMETEAYQDSEKSV